MEILVTAVLEIRLRSKHSKWTGKQESTNFNKETKFWKWAILFHRIIKSLRAIAKREAMIPGGSDESHT